MKTPPELTPECRDTLTELRLQCEKLMKRRAALLKKLATEDIIHSKVAVRIAGLEAKLAENARDPLLREALWGYQLQMILLSRTIDEGRNKLAAAVKQWDEVMQSARRHLKEQLTRWSPEEAAVLDPHAESDPAEAGKNMVDVLTVLLGDAEAREQAAAERAALTEKKLREYKEAVARKAAARRQNP